MRIWSFLYNFFLYAFAGFGLVSVAVLVAMQFGLLNVKGGADSRNQFFLDAYNEQQAAFILEEKKAEAEKKREESGELEAEGFRVDEGSQYGEGLTEGAGQLENIGDTCGVEGAKICDWYETEEWQVIKAGLKKDRLVIEQVAKEVGLPARMVASVVVPEQARFFSSNREVFKRWFEPMKLLGSLSKFSLGVSGIKMETAYKIEEYALDATSEFYPGADFSGLFAYKAGENRDEVLYDRLTDDKDHYFSYLYTALFLKEVQMQWERAGFKNQARPEILVTLFNLGFSKSKPHANPTVGGATLKIGGIDYTYGSLGGLFYYSDELRAEFPH